MRYMDHTSSYGSYLVNPYGSARLRAGLVVSRLNQAMRIMESTNLHRIFDSD